MKSATTLFCLALCLAALSFSQTALTNDSITKMVKAGLGEDEVISAITLHPANYSTAQDDLIALKEAGVSDKVVAAMIAKTSVGVPSAVPAASKSSQPVPSVPGIEPGLSMKETEAW